MDGTQIYITITPEMVTTAIPEPQSCLESVQSWIDSSKVRLNPDKTKFIVFGSKVLRNKLSHLFPVNILGKLSSPSEKVRNLGVIFDFSFRFSAQVSSIKLLKLLPYEILLGLDVTSINLLRLQMH